MTFDADAYLARIGHHWTSSHLTSHFRSTFMLDLAELPWSPDSVRTSPATRRRGSYDGWRDWSQSADRLRVVPGSAGPAL